MSQMLGDAERAAQPIVIGLIVEIEALMAFEFRKTPCLQIKRVVRDWNP